MSSSAEKIPIDGDVSNVEHAVPSKSGSSDGPLHRSPDDFGFTEAEKKAIIGRVDRRLVLTVGAMYCISLMDRTNLGAANIAGMGVDLKLIGNRYSIISLVFFVTYVVFQPPSTVIIRKIGPRLHLAIITILWGACMIGMGFVKTWEQMAACRVLLGVLEAGFFPSAVYLLSTWYTRYEVGKRNAVFYLIGSVASAFAGILAYGIMQMKGLANMNGWRWIFVIEGILTVLLGIAGYWLLVDFPDSKRVSFKFLGPTEKEWICARVNQDRGDVKVQKFSIAKYLRAGMDWKIWAYAMIFFNTTTVTYALAYFMPIILHDNMGFSIGASQCLIAPPYAFAGIIIFGAGWVGDKYRIRGPVIIFNCILCIIGLPIVGFADSNAVRYFGVFLVTGGANANVSTALSYQANNIRGQWKRAFCSASFVMFGGIGGIAGSLVFRNEDNPHYRPGLYACLATTILTCILVGLLTINFRINNKKADRGEKELECDSDDTYEPGFRYTY
ncbi:major facilitator superfamily domain-containing protein [Podospora australis]|uniref:Major facilitator superfamily domain-containing protein n=1 Tax=Podospora australis TaxID=1536484 RepID=A0AAN6X1P8_9PEZI|nr:major facilitator superfamily domain-containing protein [Podospora australis]